MLLILAGYLISGSENKEAQPDRRTDDSRSSLSGNKTEQSKTVDGTIAHDPMLVTVTSFGKAQAEKGHFFCDSFCGCRYQSKGLAVA